MAFVNRAPATRRRYHSVPTALLLLGDSDSIRGNNVTPKRADKQDAEMF